MLTYFITANDTDVGKTYVTGVLARHFAAQGNTVQVVKAVECGGSGDAGWACEFAQDERVCGHTLLDYPAPLAPLAAENSELPAPSLAQLSKALDALPLADIRLIEGAGGIAVPIESSGLDWRDFIEQIVPALTIAVVDNRLGAINQSRLLHAYLGQLPHAFVLNEIEPTSEAVKRSNYEAYQNFNYKLLGILSPGGKNLKNLREDLINCEPARPKSPGSWEDRLRKRKESHTFRNIRVPDFPASTLDLSNNDYLGLRNDSDLVNASKRAVDEYGTSSSSSPLITGYTVAHQELEMSIQQWYGGSASLLWNSGYAANHAVLKLVVKAEDVVLADRLIHNSLISGILGSGARIVRFQHNDLSHLESLLKKFSSRRVHVVTESVYSMDGDYPDLKLLASLKGKYKFNWFLDEAHAVGWYGESGSGLAEAYDVVDQVDVLTGTLGKALASGGAYTVFRNSALRDLCINEAGEFIYSTYLPPASAAIADAAIKKIRVCGSERNHWQAKAKRLREQLREKGWMVLGEDSPIVPVVFGDSAHALAMAERFLRAGLKVAAIRPPTVPRGEARLRLSLKSTLSDSDFERILDCFKESVVIHA